MCVVHNLRNMVGRSNIACLQMLTSNISSRVRSGRSCRCMFGGSGRFMLRRSRVGTAILVVPIASVVLLLNGAILASVGD